MDSSVFDYDLPPEAIAQIPAQRRDDARLLVVDRQQATLAHHRVSELPGLLPGPMDIIRNNARVLRARLRGRRATGGAVECLLLRPSDQAQAWWCLLRPGRRLPAGARFELPGNASAEVLRKSESGECLVRFERPAGGSIMELAEQVGEMPLPPYIRRSGEAAELGVLDRERYNTVYASEEKTVAAAAPTAGLHFTDELLAALSSENEFHDLTLHVGLDTFRPIQTEVIEAHRMHAETYEVPASTARVLQSPRRPRLAIGTTALRASEDFIRKGHAPPAPGASLTDEARLFIYPPDTFAIEALMTNFHLPRSTLLCLVSAFLSPGSTDGIRWLQEIYAEALRQHYRFYSYGDAMLIL